MGFRTGAYAKVWEVTPKSDTMTKLQLSVNRKNKQTGEYEQDFSGYAACIGTAAAHNALSLQRGDTIKIGDCDVSTSYDKQKKIVYTNFKIFSFETEGAKDNKAPIKEDPTQPTVDEGEVDDGKPLPW